MNRTNQEENWQEPNIGKTCAEALVKVTQNLSALEKQYLALIELAFRMGVGEKDIVTLSEKAGFRVCVWCERGHNPHEYLKKKEHFSRGERDEELGGWVCDECIVDRESEDTKRLDTPEEKLKRKLDKLS